MILDLNFLFFVFSNYLNPLEFAFVKYKFKKRERRKIRGTVLNHLEHHSSFLNFLANH